jgi:hypothetical protein
MFSCFSCFLYWSCNSNCYSLLSFPRLCAPKVCVFCAFLSGILFSRNLSEWRSMNVFLPYKLLFPFIITIIIAAFIRLYLTKQHVITLYVSLAHENKDYRSKAACTECNTNNIPQINFHSEVIVRSLHSAWLLKNDKHSSNIVVIWPCAS